MKKSPNSVTFQRRNQPHDPGQELPRHDILRWLAGERCLRVQSFGALDHFRRENAPQGAALRCRDGGGCRWSCPSDAEKIYFTNVHCGLDVVGPKWPCNVVAAEPTAESIRAALETGPYGR